MLHFAQTPSSQLDSTLGSRPELTSITVGIQGNMAVVQNMSGIIATEVGHGLGVAMQNTVKQENNRQGAPLAMRMQNLILKTR